MKLLTRLLGPPIAKAVELAEIPELDEQEYMELAKKAGFNPADAISTRKAEAETAKLRSWLAENGIPVYDDAKVTKYMNSITPDGYQWSWVGVNYNNYNGIDGQLYSKPIPAPVLMTMAKIREAFPDARFDATDMFQVPKGDPFLRVSIRLGEWFIIERWDEPGFRM